MNIKYIISIPVLLFLLYVVWINVHWSVALLLSYLIFRIELGVIVRRIKYENAEHEEDEEYHVY